MLQSSFLRKETNDKSATESGDGNDRYPVVCKSVKVGDTTSGEITRN